jgi:lysozyme
MSDKLKIMQERLTKPSANRRGKCHHETTTLATVQVNRLRHTAIHKVDTNPWGIDVSHHNGSVDWNKVHAAGAEFAFMKATEGTTYNDPTFKRNFAQARANGLLVGAYHFFQPKADIMRQVNNFVRAFGAARDGDLPPVIDVEDESLWSGLSQTQSVERVLAWIEGVRNKLGEHVQPIIYTGPSFAQDVLGNDARLANYPLWVAHYTTASRPRVPLPWKFWTLWQYGEHGRVSGISGDVDMNRFNGDRGRLNALLMSKT